LSEQDLYDYLMGMINKKEGLCSCAMQLAFGRCIFDACGMNGI
jgi:hypothetical protein